MDKHQLFEILQKQNPSVLLELLGIAYDEKNTKQRKTVFGEFIKKAKRSAVNSKNLLREIEQFHKESLKGVYYAPFEINSKNFSHIPEETEEWFDRIGEFLEESSKLTEQGDHSNAVKCFRILYELIDVMERGDEIVFAEEYGTWMIPGDENKFIKAYISSLATTVTPEEFMTAVLPLIKRDSYESFANKTYSLVISVANKEQRVQLEAEIKRQNIRTKPKK